MILRTSQGFKRVRFSWGDEPTYREKHPDRLPLVIDGKCIYDNDVLYRHAKAALQSGFPYLSKAQFPPYRDMLLVVGSGLSVEPFAEEIRKRSRWGFWHRPRPIMALKGAHDWLIERGVVPTYAVASDPQQARYDCFKRLNNKTVYLCASQMHPDTWVHLKGRRVIIWHSEVDLEQRKLPQWQNIPLVPGGCTTGLRAISLAYLLGFRNLELYGYDSCIKDGVYKIDGSTLRNGDRVTDVWLGEERFTTTLSLIPQVQGLMPTLQVWPGLKVTAHGEGYFQSALRMGKAQGWPV